MKLWDRLEITDKIFNMYELYHCEVIENAFADIDKMIAEKRSSNKAKK